MNKNRIRYYSTNRNLKGVPGIIPFTKKVSFKEALMLGQAPDEGLFMPERIPRLSDDWLRYMSDVGFEYCNIALGVADAFLTGVVSRDDLEKIVYDSYDFPVPLENVFGRQYIMRLDQGPTASFKDFAARMMARLMSVLRDEGKRLNVLVATSGDTGSAVGEAFKGVEGIDVNILYPRNEVSGRQKKQLDTIGGNVKAISVDGKFDDCQDLVKAAFADQDLARFNLTSANSISFGRILPQIIYFVYAYLSLASLGQKIVFSVPSGNFGDALGCEYARRMGIPIKKIVMATNENDEFPKFMKTGEYQKVSPSRACLSNAMNVGHPSNLARFFDLYKGTVDRHGQVHRLPDLSAMRKNIYSVSITDEKTKETIKQVYDNFKVIIEPHGAVGWAGLDQYMLWEEYEHVISVVVETAHPAKFPNEIKELLRIDPPLPESMRDIDLRTGEPVQMDCNYETFKDYLKRNLCST